MSIFLRMNHDIFVGFWVSVSICVDFHKWFIMLRLWVLQILCIYHQIMAHWRSLLGEMDWLALNFSSCLGICSRISLLGFACSRLLKLNRINFLERARCDWSTSLTASSFRSRDFRWACWTSCFSEVDFLHMRLLTVWILFWRHWRGGRLSLLFHLFDLLLFNSFLLL